MSDMTYQEWTALSRAEQAKARDLSKLHKPFIGLEGKRVKVYQRAGGSRRFNIGRSTGWQPCHLEIARRTSTGGAQLCVDFDRFDIIKPKGA